MQWVAYYSDGTWLRQYNDRDEETGRYADIDRARLVSFALYDRPASRKIFHLHLESDQRLIYRMRIDVKREITVYMVGWQQTIAGQNIQSINYIFPDGTIEAAGRFEDHEWFYAPELLPFEELNADATIS